MRAPVSRSLAGVFVVELAGSLAGAHAAKLLGDLGAQVVCVEPEGGAPMRSDAARWAAYATSRTAAAQGSEAAATWLARADVVIESSADAPLTIHPDLVGPDALHLQISPFGRSGPYADWQGSDITDQAIGGYLYLSGRPDREPLQGPMGQAALAAGVMGAIGVMAGLHARRRGGGSQTIEVTHHEALAALHQFTDVRFSHAGNVLPRMGNRYAGPGSPIGMYRASDGWIAFTVATAEHGQTLLEVTGLTHLLELPGITSVTDVMINASILDPALNGWLAETTVEEAVELLQAVRLAVAPVLTMQEVLADPQLEARAWWQATEVDGRTVRIPGPPFRIDDWKWQARPAPTNASFVDGTPPEPLPALARSAAPDQADMAGPLAGIRVLDLTRVWAGPLAARSLAELGADVVMVEAPWARMPLAVPQSYVDASHFFPDDEAGDHPWNRNGFINKFAVDKRSVGLDISSPKARAVFERLVEQADVVIENYSPRVMPNLGLGEDRLRALNPHIVYVTMPGYGRTGPARDYSAYGPVLDSHAGLSTLMGYPELDAWKCGIAWPDPVAGIHATFAVLAALWSREHDPERRGMTVEVAQFETAVSMIGDRLVQSQLDGFDPPLPGNRSVTSAPQGVYPCAGVDRWLALTVPDDRRWAALCAAVGFPADWAVWDVEQRRRNHDGIDAAMSTWTATRAPAAGAVLLQSVGVPAAPVVDGRDMLTDPHLAARGFYQQVTHPEAGTHPWSPLPARLSKTPLTIHRPAPLLGEHNRAVLREWAGYDDDEIDALIADGCLADRPPA